MTMTPDHMQVFHIDRATGWAAAMFDADGFQIGEAAFHYHKADAIRDAKTYGLPVRVFNAYGEEQRTIEVCRADGCVEEQTETGYLCHDCQADVAA